jgi:glycosyltransferase involved in cell wall biosynthesis
VSADTALPPRTGAAPAAVDPAEGGVDVTVVLPCFNERGHILEEIDRTRAALAASRYSFEILVIDDGSSDGSVDVLREVQGIRLIALAQNRGSGYARKVGTRAAKGRLVVWTDADMTYPNDRIPELVDEIEQGGFDQVVGARTSEEGTHKLLRVPAKWSIRMLAQYLTRTRIPDLNSGFRVFRREVALPYLHLLPQGFSCVTTITMAFLSNGHTVEYVPIPYAKRAGDSKFHWREDTARYLLQVVRMVMTFNPMRVFMPIGLVLMAMALGKLGYDIVTKDWRITSNAVILVIVSFQVIALGLLADLIVRVSLRGETTAVETRPVEARAPDAGVPADATGSRPGPDAVGSSPHG